MRLVLLTAVLLSATPARSEMTKQDCDAVATIAGTYVTLAADARRALETQTLATLTAGGSLEIRSAGERVDAARQAASLSAKLYAESLDNLTNILRDCAR